MPVAGLNQAQLNHLRGLLVERGRNSWQVGDFLVAVYGRASTSGISDGSRRHFAALAAELDVSPSAIVSWRNTASAWPFGIRRNNVSWALHSVLRAVPQRGALLDRFLADSERSGVRPTCARLEQFAHLNRVTQPTPSAPIAERIERLARHLDRSALVELIHRLNALLDDETTVAA